jgi:hypothetical protein
MPTSAFMRIFTRRFLKEKQMLGTFRPNGPRSLIYNVINVPNTGLSLKSHMQDPEKYSQTVLNIATATLSGNSVTLTMLSVPKVNACKY